MITKEEILEEIKRTAKENGGTPLGVDRFANETGIRPYDWGKFWAKFSDIQKEAGLSPNQKMTAYDEGFLLSSLVDLIRELGSFPTRGEMRLKKNRQSNFPTDTAYYRRFGGKWALAQKISEYAKAKGYNDVVEICSTVVENTTEKEEETDDVLGVGTVYLFKHGKYYKIGKSNDIVRRGHELRIQLPENLDLIHEIKTDDPSGIEAYWHKRFETKRMKGEWFDLNSSDVRAFKFWKRIY